MRRRLLASAAVFLVIASGVAAWQYATRDGPYELPALMVSDVSRLRATILVDSLDTPLTPKRNAVWSAALTLGWREARLRIAPQEAGTVADVVHRLSKSPLSEEDVVRESLSIFVGSPSDPRRGAAARPAEPREVAVDAMLDVSAPFRMPYFECRRHLKFTSADGNSADVRAFGLMPDHMGRYRDLRKQIRVVFRTDLPLDAPAEFALDLCRACEPYELIVARIPMQETLGKAIAYVDGLASKAGPDEVDFGVNDTMIVPEQAWQVSRVFDELEGVHANRDGIPVTLEAPRETVQFRLDRRGGEMHSVARLYFIAAGPVAYVLEQPHLVFMRGRGRQLPVLAIWIANDELLRKAKDR